MFLIILALLLDGIMCVNWRLSHVNHMCQIILEMPSFNPEYFYIYPKLFGV